MQVPAQRRGLHVTLVSLETCSDVPASNVISNFELLNMFRFQAVAGTGTSFSVSLLHQDD